MAIALPGSAVVSSIVALGHGHVGDLDSVLVLFEPHVVADADLRQNDADLGGQVLPHALDAVQQVAAAFADRPAGSGPRPAPIPSDRRSDSLRRAGRCLAASACFFAAATAWALFSRRESVTAMPTQPAPISSSGIRGRLVKIKMARKPPATANACGREKSCRRNSLGRLLSWLLRVTNMPAASEIRKAGTCVTSPSPIVSVVNSDAGLAQAHAVLDDADEQSADDVDQNDDDAGDGVAADELAGTVHRAEEVGLLGDLLPAALGLALVDRCRRSGRRRWPSACRACRRG